MNDKKTPSFSNICSRRVLVDYRTNTTTIHSLSEMGVTVYKSTPVDSLYYEVDGHPDMQIHFIDKTAFCAPEVYDYYRKCNFKDIELICCSKSLSAMYPDDTAYNICNLGKYVVARPLSATPEILTEYRRLKKEFLSVKQGYAKCNICTVDKDAAITSDNGIYKVLKNAGIDVLKIQNGFIELYGMEGFIGGASGLVNKTMCFNGDLKTHPDYRNIKSFCLNFGVDTVSLNSGILKDIGSILEF